MTLALAETRDALCAGTGLERLVRRHVGARTAHPEDEALPTVIWNCTISWSEKPA
jgi:hypothetical protein